VKKFKVLCSLAIGLLLVFSAISAQTKSVLVDTHQKFNMGKDQNEIVSEGTESSKSVVLPLIGYVEGKTAVGEASAEINMSLNKNDIVTTEDGRVEIILGNGDLVRLDKNTEIKLVSFDEKSVVFTVTRGAVFVKSAQKTISIEAKNFTQMVENGSYVIQVAETGLKSLPPREKPADDFGRFNLYRDQEIAEPTQQKVVETSTGQPKQPTNQPEQKVEEKQLPKDFKEQLADYGKWVDDSEYGKVWVPNNNEKENWKPYQDGTWQDYSSGNYYWNSYEPFGWATYHYGWWQWSPIWSWYWIPGYIWGPAWVNWYWWGSYAYWSPMWYSTSYYNQYYNQCYAYSNYRGWSGGITRNQLKDPNLSRVLRTTRTNSVQIATNQIHSNSRMTNTQTRVFGTHSQSRTSPNITKSFPSRISTPSVSRNSNLSRTSSQNRLADSPWSNDPRTKIQSTSRSSSSRISNTSRSSASPLIRFNGLNRSHPAPFRSVTSSRSSGPTRSYSAPSRVSASSRSFSAPRATSSARGSNVRRR